MNAPTDEAVDAVRQMVSPGEHILVTRSVWISAPDAFQLPANRTLKDIKSYSCRWNTLHIEWTDGTFSDFENVLTDGDQDTSGFKNPDIEIDELPEEERDCYDITTLPSTG